MSDTGIDARALDTWLRASLGSLSGSPRIERIGGGQSNPTFFVDYDDRQLVVRKQPPGTLLPSAHAVDREYRVISPLADTNVPVPRALAFCADRGVIGTPFYVMERLHGRVFHDCTLPGLMPAERTSMYRAMARTLAALHGVDPASVQLSDYGRPGGYFARQIARWTRQWEASRTREDPNIDRLIAWLPAHVPPGDVVAISHGDFRIGNLMFHETEPRIIAVLDWELSTLGHPLADLAHACIAWQTAPDEYGGLLGLPLAAEGIPEQSLFEADYAAASRHGMRLEPFHMAFALFRWAVIFEGIAARARAGNAASADAARVGPLAARFAARAAALIP
jgi:aminoglycoside phosphotransferase (APT) family kinase protein